jgi:hypothetical protein
VRSTRGTATNSDIVGRGQEGSAKRFRRRAGQPDRKKLRASHLSYPSVRELQSASSGRHHDDGLSVIGRSEA